MSPHTHQRGLLGVALLPFLLFVGVFVFCVLWTFYVSFTDRSLIGRAASDPHFIWFRNYVRLFGHSDFLNSLKVSVLFTVVSGVICQCGIGLTLASAMRSGRVHVKGIVQTALLLGWLVPDMVAAFMWGAFAGRDGLLNAATGIFGIGAVNWITEYPMTTIMIANVWKGTAWSYLLFTAALDSLSREVLEAADLDGATWFQKLRLVIMPIIRPQIAVNLLLVTIWTFGYFPLVYGITGGGPGRATELLPILMYKEAFESFKIGYGAAIGISMMLSVGFVAIFYFRLQKSPTV